jgi:oligogalacturonide transport system substrate-binding protein
MGLAITKTCEHPAEAATLINFLLNETAGAEIMGSECGIPASKAGLAAAQSAGKIKELVAEANGKVMAFVSNQLDPLFESNDLKATGTGVYQEVFDTLDYDNVSGADLVDTLLDGMESVGYTV